jgi:hypothetical protein
MFCGGEEDLFPSEYEYKKELERGFDPCGASGVLTCTITLSLEIDW